MKLGVCWYPEQWPEDWWARDAAEMAALGISRVRIGEFAWSRIEPEPGRFDWGWLDRAVETLAGAGLEIILCTPTATPPRWMLEVCPDLLPVDSEGRTRGFGSRRHYDFSSESYRREAARITEAVAGRYGAHPAVVAWQTDNEYGCHDTTRSYSPAAAARFRQWLARRHQSPDALNRAWGNVFWSQDYADFDQVGLPNLTVTEANPSHRLDFARFASEEVASFNRIQTEIIRRRSPGRDVTHNFMGFVTDFDHFQVAAHLDVAAWDSYPLGFLEMFGFAEAEKLAYLRQGHPDIAAFHHDLYRGVGRGRMWVMEQQPGPVNWARFNPDPLPGMVRTWTWEAFAHGAELVSYFRWRQAPFAQEQMHAGLNRPDRTLDRGGEEARQVAQDLTSLGDLAPCGRAKAALVFSYEACWAYEIQPHARGTSAVMLAFEAYGALRRLGLDVDIVAPGQDLAGYRLVVVPALPIITPEAQAALEAADAVVLFGPRSGSRTVEGHIPPNLPPGPLQARLPLKVVRVESLRPDAEPAVQVGPSVLQGKLWREQLETALPALATFQDGGPAWVRAGRWHYLATWPEPELYDAVMAALAEEAGLARTALEPGVRLRTRDGVTFCVNFAAERRRAPAPAGGQYVLGSGDLAPGGVCAWRAA